MTIIAFPYAIPDEYILETVPEKLRLFSEMDPGITGSRSSYRFGPGQEKEYHQQYRESRFATTKMKGGWDCLRHYEILANGCIPVFENIDNCPKSTMVSFPKDLVKEACNKLLPWKETEEYIQTYNDYVILLLDHCRKHCSTSALTSYFLTNLPIQPTKILMINSCEGANYTREFLSIGLRRMFGADFIEYPKNRLLYSEYDHSKAHGYGFTYSGKFSEDLCNRENIEDRISNREFDLVIFGKIGAAEMELGTYPKIPLIQTVLKHYTKDEIAFLYGGDGLQNLFNTHSFYTQHLLSHEKMGICFVRELIH